MGNLGDLQQAPNHHKPSIANIQTAEIGFKISPKLQMRMHIGTTSRTSNGFCRNYKLVVR